VLRPGGLTFIPWRDVRCGDVVKVSSSRHFNRPNGTSTHSHECADGDPGIALKRNVHLRGKRQGAL
jgi:hypothetical protein